MNNEPSQPRVPQTPDNPRTPESGQPVQPGQDNQPSGYKKRPIWQWVVLYVIAGAIIYALIYILFMSGRSTGY
ncbi:MAG TPA: hypothetical protein VFT59_05570 [Candidatus Saccharimonadales bacterium]|nr:hypothetical protein [Candidatus Saccharimonadales bacterium]